MVRRICAGAFPAVRFNFLLTDGSSIYATACGDSLFVLEGGSRVPGGVVVASEPFDDDPAWRPVPELSAVQVIRRTDPIEPPRGGRMSLDPLDPRPESTGRPPSLGAHRRTWGRPTSNAQLRRDALGD